MTRTRILSILVAWLLVSIGLWLNDADPSVVALAGIVAVAAAVGLVALDLAPEARSVRWPRALETHPAAEPRSERVPRPLADVEASIRAHPAELLPDLVALVDDRLISHHGIDRHATPAAADAVLTPALRAIVSGSNRPIESGRELTAIVDDIEAL